MKRIFSTRHFHFIQTNAQRQQKTIHYFQTPIMLIPISSYLNVRLMVILIRLSTGTKTELNLRETDTIHSRKMSTESAN